MAVEPRFKQRVPLPVHIRRLARSIRATVFDIENRIRVMRTEESGGVSDEPLTRTTSCFGYCTACTGTHALPVGRAHHHARQLMREFEEIQRLDYLVPSSAADPALGFDHLFPGERGHMFGVLECRDEKGQSVVLRAFSSLHEGVREIDGWVPPILSPETYRDILLPGQAEIKKLTGLIRSLDSSSPRQVELLAKRRKLSQELMEEIQSLYWFHNFHGEKRSLREAFLFPESIPGGVGECCAPKLLNHAARRGLTPVGIAEFYWGVASPSGRLKAGEFYPCCEARCRPLLGFMLCGVQDVS
jgi:hypothetical protein